MKSSLKRAAPPPCFARTVPGLEQIAAEEIVEKLDGTIKRTAPGLVVFRSPSISQELLSLRTVEDIFVLLWGADNLSRRREDLSCFEKWTSGCAAWQDAVRIHQEIRPRRKGKPTYHLVTQMDGRHIYHRAEAAKAFARGLSRKIPPTWRRVNEDAAIEVWLSIFGSAAICGLRLSDYTLRHREYKHFHRPASLRPVVAAALLRLADAGSNHVVIDPTCGVGTIIAEHLILQHRGITMGGDMDVAAVHAAIGNLQSLGRPELVVWDARRLPLRDNSIDRIVCNPPFGKQLETQEGTGTFYRKLVSECHRVMRPNGRVVFLVWDANALVRAAHRVGWKIIRRVRMRVLGQSAEAIAFGSQ